jgi:hypothetical protein
MDEMSPESTGQDAIEPESSAAQGSEEEVPALPPFYKRVVDVFFNPAQLGRALKDHPAWGVAMLVGAVLVAAMVVLIPADIWAEMQRQAILRSGQQMPEVPATMETFMKWARPLGGAFGMAVSEFVYAGVITLVFVFVMGDEGRYRQYLAVVTHAWLVTALVELLLVPLKIAQGDPQLTVSVGTFFFFLPQGYLLKALNLMALSKFWSLLVVAAGAHAIDPKRKFATAATVLLLLSVATALIFAIFTPTMN